jgi:hypothetical protein
MARVAADLGNPRATVSEWASRYLAMSSSQEAPALALRGGIDHPVSDQPALNRVRM